MNEHKNQREGVAISMKHTRILGDKLSNYKDVIAETQRPP